MLLVGFVHAEEREAEEGCRLAMEAGVQRVGVELPADYRELRRDGIGYLVFSELAEQLEVRGVEVVGLEDPGRFRQTTRLMMARTVLREPEAKARLQEHLKLPNGLRYRPLEEIPAYHIQRVKDVGAALRLAEKVSRRKIEELSEADHARREAAYVAAAPGLDMLAIGYRHAERIQERLPGWRYVRVGEVPKAPEIAVARRGSGISTSSG